MRTMRTNLIIDTESVVLRAISSYYAKSKSQEIRRSELLNLTGPDGNKMAPATFERCLNRLQKSQILNRNKIAKVTVIIFNINMVNSTLKKKNQRLHLRFQSITEEIPPETWESIFETVVNENMKQTASAQSQTQSPHSGYAQSLTANAFSGMSGIVMSRSLELSILQDSWDKVKQVRQEAVVQLIKAVMRFTEGNPNEPFKITIEFNGFSQTRAKVSNELYPQIIQKMAPHLLLFSEHVMKHKFSKKDQLYLRHSQLHCMSSRSRKCVDTFMDSIDKLARKIDSQ
jgi:hypothetical protein